MTEKQAPNPSYGCARSISFYTKNYINMFSTHKGKTYFYIFLIFSFFSCNKNSTNPFARAYHNTTSYFNYYYNANKLFREKLDEIDKAYKFPNRGLIEIYYLGKEEDMKTYYEGFDKVIKKNEVLIYKHPNCRWVDNARHLQGKAFLYKGQNSRAVKNYEEVIAKYAGSRITNDVYLWLAKSYYYMDNKEMSKTILEENLIERPGKPFKKRFKGELAIFRSQLHISEAEYEAAAYQLSNNLRFVRGKRKKAKVNYLLGQLFAEIGNLPLALEHFAKAEKLSQDYSIAFKAKMQRARTLINMPGKDKSEVYAYLFKLEKDEKNLDYLDQVYYELGLLEEKQKNIPNALGYYKKSIAASTENKKQKALSYFKTGEVYFYQKKNYDRAVAYFDSAVQTIEPTAEEYKDMKMMYASLKEYVEYKNTIAYQDSMLYLAELPKEKVEELIAQAKAEAEKKRIAAELKALEQENSNSGSGSNFDPFAQPTAGNSTWAFDDPAKVSEGRLQFKQTWGDRKNEDNWRRRNKELVAAGGNPENPDENNPTAEGGDSKELSPEDSARYKEYGENYAYYKDIPYAPEAKEIALELIENAYYRLGNIYDQKLSQPDSAIAMFNTLLKRFPESKHLLPANYSLFRIYKAKGNAKYVQHKDFILNDYPKSIYAMLIRGASPEEIAEQTQDFEFAYKGLFGAYRDKQYESALGFAGYLIEKFHDHTDVRMDQVYYIKALCMGYLGERDSLRSGLTYVVSKFADSPVKAPAQRILDALAGMSPGGDLKGTLDSNTGQPKKTDEAPKPAPIKKDDPRFKNFNSNPKPNSPFFVMFYLDTQEMTETERQQIVSDFNKQKFAGKSIQKIPYEENPTSKSLILTVRSFNSEFEAVEYIWQLSDAGLMDFLLKKPADRAVWITQENFTVGFGKKSLKDYLLFYDNVLTK